MGMAQPAELAREAAKVVAPPPELTTSQWADAERYLSPESNPEPGRWITDRAPYAREIMDAPSEEGVHSIVWVAASQVGKTEVLLNLIGYHIHQDPAPMLLVQPTLDLAEAFSKDRLAPMVRDTPALTDKVKDARSRDSNNTLLQKKFPGGHITLSGANSPSSLASRPIRIVMCDEIDRYPASAGAEGNPVRLAEKRAKNFFNRLFVKVSTPTVEGRSPIMREFESSDKRHYNVPCPLCDKKQKLRFPNIKWEKDERGMPVNVRYQCIHCRGEFDDSKKDWMLLNGKWIAEGVFRGVAGFHINALYSPWTRWAELVTEWIEAQKDPEDLKVFVNTSLGETWKEPGEEVPDWEQLHNKREHYKQGTVPDPVIFLTAGVDVQKDRLEAEIVGWGVGRQSWSIDYRVILGDTTEDETWDELEKLLSREFPRANGQGSLPIRLMAVDSGFNTQDVYSWVRKQPKSQVIAVKGSGSLSTTIGSPTIVDVNRKSGKRIRRGVRVWPVGVGTIKSQLYGWLKIKKPEKEGEPFKSGYCHFPEYDEEHFKMLTAEQIVIRKIKGFPIYEWQKIRERNEALDCRVYARAAAAAVGMDLWNDDDWLAMAGEAGVTLAVRTEAAPPEPAPSAQKADGPEEEEVLRPEPESRSRRSSFWNRR